MKQARSSKNAICYSDEIVKVIRMKGKSLTTMQLFQICRLSKQRGYKIHKTLLNYNCLKPTEYGYVINPDYYINGKAPDPALLKYYRSESEQDGDRLF
ncbi:hypothetical protein [Brevibacillus laterosporus]|uniref:hypothetical protein n=1 Tax=Brevibacillus laterosporus TaxID=1465 RepID=UPI0003B19444|nr:hypothetical protein [Brevibacillus laterosporus]ERM17722.1 hypothetical protein P615_19125 [Brevibacillus laterosporus PE36]